MEAPQNIEFFAVSPSSVTFTFNGVPDGNANGAVTGYTIYYQPIGGIPSNENLRRMNISSSVRTVTVTGLEENVMYRFWITASNSAGEGPRSNTVVIRTKAGKYLLYLYIFILDFSMLFCIFLI